MQFLGGLTGRSVEGSLMIFLAMGLCVIPFTSAAFGASEGCSRFCRATGFNGVVGKCACGLSLFSAKKRSIYPSRLSDPFGWQSPNVDWSSDQATPSASVLSQPEYQNPFVEARFMSNLAAFLGHRIPLIHQK